MDNYTRISEGLKNGHYTANPHEAANDLAVLAGEYAYAMGGLEQILQRKPAIWNELRKNFKSDTACERAWQSTKDGMDEMTLRLREKAIGRMISALRTLVRIATEEARNNL